MYIENTHDNVYYDLRRAPHSEYIIIFFFLEWEGRLRSSTIGNITLFFRSIE